VEALVSFPADLVDAAGKNLFVADLAVAPGRPDRPAGYGDGGSHSTAFWSGVRQAPM